MRYRNNKSYEPQVGDTVRMPYLRRRMVVVRAEPGGGLLLMDKDGGNVLFPDELVLVAAAIQEPVR